MSGMMKLLCGHCRGFGEAKIEEMGVRSGKTRVDGFLQ